MCYAIPGKVTRLEGKIAFIDYFGEEKKAINEFDSLGVGDYIYAQGGYIIEQIPSESAQSILSVWKETFFELQEVDLRLAEIDGEEKGLDKKARIILDKALENIPLRKTDLSYLMQLKSPSDLALLYKSANFLRQKYHKNSCCVHGILEISNYCSKGCHYCGIARDVAGVERYRMTSDEIIENACKAVSEFGFRALVLQGGEDAELSVDELAKVIREIKKRVGVLICISFGERGLTSLDTFFQAGARALLMRFETSNPVLYEKMHPGSSLETRLAHLRHAHSLGFLIMTGGLIGLPGQTIDDIVDDIFLARELNSEMYSFGPFIPGVNTPLEKEAKPAFETVLKTIACMRLLDAQQGKILITTAFETLYPEARQLGLLSGANSVMLNVTEPGYRKRYSIYPERAYQNTSVSTQISETLYLLRSLGRAPTDLGVA